VPLEPDHAGLGAFVFAERVHFGLVADEPGPDLGKRSSDGGRGFKEVGSKIEVDLADRIAFVDP
jgi:hypothetical protein